MNDPDPVRECKACHGSLRGKDAFVCVQCIQCTIFSHFPFVSPINNVSHFSISTPLAAADSKPTVICNDCERNANLFHDWRHTWMHCHGVPLAASYDSGAAVDPKKVKDLLLDFKPTGTAAFANTSPTLRIAKKTVSQSKSWLYRSLVLFSIFTEYRTKLEVSHNLGCSGCNQTIIGVCWRGAGAEHPNLCSNCYDIVEAIYPNIRHWLKIRSIFELAIQPVVVRSLLNRTSIAKILINQLIPF
jgi:hypothetical protein